jgi:hypothetical protein
METSYEIILGIPVHDDMDDILVPLLLISAVLRFAPTMYLLLCSPDVLSIVTSSPLQGGNNDKTLGRAGCW